MGGYGSGRWSGYTPKDRAEDSLILNVKDLVRSELVDKATNSGSLDWYRAGKQIASVGFSIEKDEDCRSIWLQYTVGPAGQQGREVDSLISLEATRQHFGGFRFWFLCPSCGKRACKLYLCRKTYLFSCRRCSDLTYKSSQESHKDDRFDARMAAETGIDVATVKQWFKELSLDPKRRRRLARRRWKRLKERCARVLGLRPKDLSDDEMVEAILSSGPHFNGPHRTENSPHAKALMHRFGDAGTTKLGKP